MRIDSFGRTSGAPSGPRPAGQRGGFSLAETAQGSASRQAAPLSSAPSLDALIALQAFQEEGPREKKRREIARGRGLLDVLDGLKLAMIDGRGDPAALRALAAQLSETRRATGEPGLDEVLLAIELRAEVELAKRGA